MTLNSARLKLLNSTKLLKGSERSIRSERYLLSQFEDETRRSWTEGVTNKVENEHRAHPANVLVTFAQPWTDHLAGLRLRGKFWRVPWIAHFSDPWVDNPYVHFRSDLERDLESEREEAVVKWADALVFVTQRTAEMVMQKYPDKYRNKAHVIPHAYDEEILATANGITAEVPAKKPDALRLVFTGQFLLGTRIPDSLLHAVARMKSNAEVEESEIELVFVGAIPPNTIELINTLGLQHIVSYKHRVDYLTSLVYAHSADVLLIIDAPSQNSVFLPSKLVDYLAIRKPILALTPVNGEVADLMRELDYAVVEPRDVDGAYRELKHLMKKHKKGNLKKSDTHEEVMSRFNLQRVANQFSDLADLMILQRPLAGSKMRWYLDLPKSL